MKIPPVTSFDVGQVFMWLMSLVVASLGGLSYLHGNFESKESAKEMRKLTHHRLDRIESKIDTLIQKR